MPTALPLSDLAQRETLPLYPFFFPVQIRFLPGFLCAGRACVSARCVRVCVCSTLNGVSSLHIIAYVHQRLNMNKFMCVRVVLCVRFWVSLLLFFHFCALA